LRARYFEVTAGDIAGNFFHVQCVSIPALPHRILANPEIQ